MNVAFYVAIAENGVIGKDGVLPWRLSSDLKRFKADTMGKPVVMGRKTFASIGRPLPGRANVVITRDRAFRAEGADVVASADEALTLAAVRGRCLGVDETAVIGGGEVFAELLPRAARLHVTHVLASIEGDTFFPGIDWEVWKSIQSIDVPAGDRDSHPTRHVVYERQAPEM